MKGIRRMFKSLIIGLLLLPTIALAQEIRFIDSPNNRYYFMQVHVKIYNDKTEQNETANEKFFIGRLPKVGEGVEMVYIGSNDDGSMNFNLKVKD